jgi:acetyl-CoA acetyltransferase
MSQRVAIVGVGYSTVGRNTGLSVDELVAQCSQSAMLDAGLDRNDIDGLSTVGSDPLSDAWSMGIEPLNWFDNGSANGPAFATAAVNSIAAVASGFCHTALTLRIIKQKPSSSQVNRTAAPMGTQQFLVPFGAGSPLHWAGLMSRRHMVECGTTEDQFGLHAIAQRDYAVLNEDAFFRDPLTMDEYQNSRYVAKPVRILDCDYPCDAGSAVIFTTEERARDLRKPVVLVDSFALSAIRDQNFELMPDMVRTSPEHCAQQLWKRTDLKPDAIDTAQLYDGFAVIAFQWLEALGFCEPGGAGAFIEAGETNLDGKLPMNTDGGACNVGRRHGANFCIEATRQLRGECGSRQVEDASTAVWSNGVGPFSAAVLLVRD